MKLLLAKNPIHCKFDGCYKSYQSHYFGHHLEKEHNTTREEYARLFKTEEYKKCPWCGKMFFSKTKSTVDSCCCIRCTRLFNAQKIADIRTKSGSYILANKKGAKTKKEKYGKNGFSPIQIEELEKARQRMKVDGTYKEIGKKSARKRKERGTGKIGAFKAAITKKISGMDKKIAKKIVETRLLKNPNSFRDASKIRVETMLLIDPNVFKEIGKKISKWCKNNPEKKKAAVRKAADKMLRDGTYDTIHNSLNYINRRSYFKKGHYVSTKTSVDHVFDSSWEYIRFKQLDEDPNVVWWHKNKSQKIPYFKYILRTNSFKEAKCIPDIFVIYVNGIFEIEEVKGEETLNSCLKCDAIKEFCKNNNMNFKYLYKNNLFSDEKWETIKKEFLKNYKGKNEIYS
jgi:hypothetical protein